MKAATPYLPNERCEPSAGDKRAIKRAAKRYRDWHQPLACGEYFAEGRLNPSQARHVRLQPAQRAIPR